MKFVINLIPGVEMYNSALKNHSDQYYSAINGLKGIDEYISNNLFLFQMDLSNIDGNSPYLVDCYDCDCIYTHISGPQGYDVFKERSNINDNSSYNDYLMGLKQIILKIKKPTYIICNKEFCKFMSSCGNGYRNISILLDDVKCNAILLTIDDDNCNIQTSTELENYLRNKYHSVYDPCCGFGKNIKGFKFAVGSDIDRKCLEYIKINNEYSR